MSKLSVIPTDLLEQLFELALLSAVSPRDFAACDQAALLLDNKPSEPQYDEEIYQRFSICAPILNLTDMSRDEQGRFKDPRTRDAFAQYAGMMVRHGQDPLAQRDKANGFFRALGEASARLTVQPDAERAFERAFDLLARLDQTMPLAQVLVWLREFLGGSQNAVLAMSAAEGGWIQVEAGKPPEDVMVLVSTIDRGSHAPIKVGYYENGEAKIFGGSWTPTHWRLLPPPVVVGPIAVQADAVENAP